MFFLQHLREVGATYENPMTRGQLERALPDNIASTWRYFLMRNLTGMPGCEMVEWGADVNGTYVYWIHEDDSDEDDGDANE